jgi:hypothetical protein
LQIQGNQQSEEQRFNAKVRQKRNKNRHEKFNNPT